MQFDVQELRWNLAAEFNLPELAKHVSQGDMGRAVGSARDRGLSMVTQLADATVDHATTFCELAMARGEELPTKKQLRKYVKQQLAPTFGGPLLMIYWFVKIIYWVHWIWQQYQSRQQAGLAYLDHCTAAYVARQLGE